MINRRNFLKTSALAGGALAFSPSFNLFGATAQSKYPQRFIFIRKSNGNLPVDFAPLSFSDKQKKMHKEKVAFEADLDKHELPKWLNALDGHKENMTLLHGLSTHMVSGGHYAFSGCMGAYNVQRNAVSRIKRATVDFELAKLFPSPFGHVEFTLASGSGTVEFRKGIVSGFAAPAPQQRNYAYADPQTAYDDLFKSVLDLNAVDADNSLLTYLKEEEENKLKGLDHIERMKISDNVKSIQAIRERNKKVAAMSSNIKQNMPKLDKVHASGGANAGLVEKQGAFTDVMLSALISGLTNVALFTIDDLGTPIDTLPGNKNKASIHGIGHKEHAADGPVRALIKTSHMAQVARIVDKLKSVPEGNGTMFDNTTIIYMPESGDGHHSVNNEAPTVILSGKNTKLDIAGRYIRLPFHATEGHKTLSNWYTTLLNTYGNPISHYGDLDLKMSRNKIPQLGNINQLMG